VTIFLDSANINDIRKYLAYGIISGITTNQKIWLKERGVDFQKRLIEILKVVGSGRPVSVELTKTDAVHDAELIQEAENYSQLKGEVVIKVPMWGDGRGLRIAHKLIIENIPVNMTCCISVNQAILACELGVEYVSLFYNRIKDYLLKEEGLREENALITTKNVFIKTRNFIDTQNFSTKIIAGSIRKPEDVMNALCSGAHIATITPEVLEKLPFHPKTEETIKEFDNCWRKFQK